MDLGIDEDVPDNRYDWRKFGRTIADNNENTLVIDNVSLDDTGPYDCRVTNPAIPNTFVLPSRTIFLEVVEPNQNTQLKASFTTDKQEACIGSTITFTDASTGKPDTWKWDFGNGQSSEEQNPQLQFSEAGCFDVTLTVSSESATNTFRDTCAIEIIATPEIGFEWFQEPDCERTILTFKDRSPDSANINNYLWEFSNGERSTVRNPVIELNGPTSLEATLSASNTAGCEQSIKQDVEFDPPLTINLLDKTSPSCGQNNGAIEIGVVGGKGELSIVWDNDLEGKELNNLTEGLYTVRVKDENECEKELDIILEP